MRARIQKISRYAPSIFQGRIDFSARSRGFSLTAEHPAERLLFRGLFLSLAVLSIFYVYFVGASVLNVIARKEALAQSASLASAVAELESRYFAASQELGPEDGSRLGLTPVTETSYVHRPGNAASAALPSNEI